MRSWWRWGLVAILRRFSWNQLDEESDEDKGCPMSCHLVPMGNVSCSSSKGECVLIPRYHYPHEVSLSHAGEHRSIDSCICTCALRIALALHFKLRAEFVDSTRWCLYLGGGGRARRSLAATWYKVDFLGALFPHIAP